MEDSTVRPKIVLTTVALLTAMTAIACNVRSREASRLKQIQQERAGEYVITLLNDSGQLKQGPNLFVIEFRRAADNKMVNAGDVQMNSTLPSPGLPDRVASASVKFSGEIGRYNASCNFPVSGTWNTTLLYENGRSTVLALNVR